MSEKIIKQRYQRIEIFTKNYKIYGYEENQCKTKFLEKAVIMVT